MNHIKCYIVFFGIIIISGCVPYNFTEQPGVVGKIIDAETDEPIDNVSVRLEYKSNDKIIINNIIIFFY